MNAQLRKALDMKVKEKMMFHVLLTEMVTFLTKESDGYVVLNCFEQIII